MGWRIFVVFFGGHPPPPDLFFKKPYYNIVKVTSHLHEINRLGNISPLENVNLFTDYHYWLRRPRSWEKRKWGKMMHVWKEPSFGPDLGSYLPCHSIGCFLFLPWRDTDPRSASEKNKLIYGGTQIQYHFPFRVPPEHWEVAAVSKCIPQRAGDRTLG